MIAYEDVQILADKLTPLDKARLLEYLSAALKQELQRETNPQMTTESFVALTYGSLSDNPIERNQPSQPDTRDWDV